MTFRKAQSQSKRRSSLWGLRDRLRNNKRRQDRRSLLESLETRHLMAGPQLIGIQPNEGQLLFEPNASGATVLNVAPNELVFRFDDDTQIDPATLSAIRITRAGDDGSFEAASASTDFNTGGQISVEFRARQSGTVGNGIQIVLTSAVRTDTALPRVTVTGNTVNIELNRDSIRTTRVQDLISAVNNSAAASSLVEAIQVSGPSLGVIGDTVISGTTLTLQGANAAQALTDFGTGGAVRVRLTSQLPGVDGRGTQLIVEQRDFGTVANPVVVVTDSTIRVQLNSNAGNESTVNDFIAAINNNPDSSRLISVAIETGSGTTRIGNRAPSLYSPVTLSGVGDVVVEPGFIGLGDSPREVVFRFAQPLPDDTYQIDILGSGPLALRNVDGELFRDGTSFTRQFKLNLGPQVVAVVPEPIRRTSSGALAPQIGKIEVHFNDDDLDPALANNADFYQLIFTNDTATNTDDFTRANTPSLRPVSVNYNNITNIATLDFGRPLSRIPNPNAATEPGRPFLTGSARLRVGTTQALPAPPTQISLGTNNPIEPSDTFGTDFTQLVNLANNGGNTLTGSATVSSEIFNPDPFTLELPGPDLPGTRNIRPEDPTRLLRTVPLDYVRNSADVVDGISVIQYNFAPSWLGDDPNRPGIAADTTYFNVISQQQRQRVREVLQLYSEYLGVQFVEVEGEPTSDAFFSIAVGDLYGGDERVDSGPGGVAVVTRDRDGDGIADLGVMDFQDFDESIDDQFGGEFFRGAMLVVGQLLGYGYADDLPQPVTQNSAFVFTPGTDNEPSFPAPADILHGQYLYRPDSVDVDLYRFQVQSSGRISIETIAERLGVPSLLDTALRLYRVEVDGTTREVISAEEVAQNDDYFSNDSLIDVEVDPGTYVIGVSAKGNTQYDPAIPGTGFGGRSEGEYELRIDFRPTVANTLKDTTGVSLDGDGDNRPGGVFDFWFVPADADSTLYVDKAASPVTTDQIGTIGNPYREIDQAIAAARSGDTIRIVGNGGADNRVETLVDNLAYNIGFASNGVPLEDGSSLDLPQGVRMVIDSGAILKFSRARLGVGSTAALVDQSDASLQVLGTPTIIGVGGLPARDVTNAIIPGSVIFTSVNDRSVGIGNAPAFSPAPRSGDWGGIDFRGDLDNADELRRNREDEGAFLNHIQFADMRYGGGAVSIGGRNVVVSPIDMAVTRPTIINSRISLSADAAIAATPNTFAETRFTESKFQSTAPFTPDFVRVGPEIHGNTIVDNSINGLFVRVVTRTGDNLETVSVTARFDDTDIPHVLTENLVVDGTPGGPIILSSAPSSLLIRTATSPTGDIPAGTYVYRITNVDGSGIESAASQPTLPVTLTGTGGVQLSQLPTAGAGTGFVARRLYRATVDQITGLPGQFRLVSQLNASSTSFVDRLAAGTTPLTANGSVLRSRLDASLTIDPGTTLKIDGARIEARFGANLLIEGSPSNPIVFTSLEDQRYGGGGTFDTNNVGTEAAPAPEDIRGDWGGLYIGNGSTASLDNVVIAGAGGSTRIEGGFASFNPVEVHQGTLRIAHSRFEFNADGRESINGTRVGRGDNASGTVFVRASTPIVIENTFLGGIGPALTFDINSLNGTEVVDMGRANGLIDRMEVVGNAGPLVQGNTLDNNTINGMQIRGGVLATAGVWDDVDIVHVATESIEIPNQHVFGGLKLRSDSRGSLVVKFQSDENENAGIVVGGSLLSAGDQFRDIADRIGGSLQVLGHPDFPVVLTTLSDDFSGAGFTPDGRPQVDTNNDGFTPANEGDAADGFALLPTGPEVNRGTTIDNDVLVSNRGYFEATVGNGNDVSFLTGSGVTVENLATGQLLINQNYIFEYLTYVRVGTTVTSLSATTITQPATLVADDVVESRGTFAGANGLVSWTARSYFLDGVATLFTSLTMDAAAGTTLGDVRVISFLDEDVVSASDDVLYTVGTPGQADFRVFTIDGPFRVGFSHGGFYSNDGLNQQNATYVGWAANQFPALQAAITGNTANFTIPGTINALALPANPDPTFGTVFGPNDITTAFAWDVDTTATSSQVTSFLELLAADPAVVAPNQQIESGLWEGVTIREGANDRNVAAFAEQEPNRTSVVDENMIPSQSQFLGELAPDLQSGDENRRLGFIVDGAIAKTSDLDVYSFIGQSGTEVWLDIDKTGNRLDSIVELIDVNGNVLASSNDSVLAESNPLALYPNANFPGRPGVDTDIAQPLSVVEDRLESQRITISESIVAATGGELAVQIEGVVDPLMIPVDAFVTDPAAAIEQAIESQFPTAVGLVTATLARRNARIVDPNNPGVILRGGDPFEIELRFNESFFVGRQPPQIAIQTSGVVGAFVTASVVTFIEDSQLQDTYSFNPRDAGMRIILPGEIGTRNIYHVRVRSSNTTNPLDFATVINPALVSQGMTLGRYELQIRLQETDESPGTQIRLGDIRYAVNGVQVIGQPLHSPLLGEDYETVSPNEVRANAQPLGYFGVNNDATINAVGPLQSDRLAKSFAGELDSLTDVDWYRFSINYDNITPDNAALFLSTVFDLDYADNFARADMALYVFNAAGQLIMTGGDSNIADDQSGRTQSNDTGDLSRGSAGSNDPYIGAAELAEGDYFVAVSNQQRVPEPLSQFFQSGSNNPLLRLEPIPSVQRIVEDRIDFSGGGTASAPIVPVLFDDNSVVPYTLSDVILYVNTPTGLIMVNPFTGQNYGTVGNFTDNLSEVAFRSNGEMFSYSMFPAPNRQTTDTTWFYYTVDSGTAALSAPLSPGAGITTFEATQNVDPTTGVVTFPVVAANVGIDVEAISIAAASGTERGFLVGNRTAQLSADARAAGARYDDNILYEFSPETGQAIGPPVTFLNRLSGAATGVQEIGKINTDPADDPNVPAGTVVPEDVNVLGITAPNVIGPNGVSIPGLVDGDTFTISESGAGGATNRVTFEFNSGLNLLASGASPVLDGQTVRVDTMSGATITSTIFEFDTGERLRLSAVPPTAGSTVNVVGENGQQATFQFVRGGTASTGNIAIDLLDAAGQPRTSDLLAAELALRINLSVANVSATSSGNDVLFNGPVVPTITNTGTGITLVGAAGTTVPNSIPVPVSSNISPELLISRLAEAARLQGISVASAGNQIAFPLATSIVVSTAPGTTAAPPLVVTGDAGVQAGNIEIRFEPGDTAQSIATRIVDAVNNGGIPELANVTASLVPGGSRSVRFVNGIVGPVVTTNGALRTGGARLAGTVTGIEVLNNGNMFAVTDRGELYVIPAGTLNSAAPRGIGTLVDSATDLLGIPFTGLRGGPVSYNDGELRETLFGITANGTLYAFNTAGELQPVFAGGRTSIQLQGTGGAIGLDFSTLAFNMWHATPRRSADPGHGINALDNGTRTGFLGGSSLAFSYDGLLNGNFPSSAEIPVRQNSNGTIANPRLDGELVDGTYNFPGGAKGALESNTFSLETYSVTDQPVLYFNYFLETDDDDGGRGQVTDSLRVFVIAENGVQHLLATNNEFPGPNTTDASSNVDVINSVLDEYDDPFPVGEYNDNINVTTQPLFDSTNSWRQARVSLGEFAGQKNLRLRVEYATAGSYVSAARANDPSINNASLRSTDSLRTTPASVLREGQMFVLAGETFSIDFSPTVSFPSGPQLATLYTGSTTAATITIQGQEYVLNDGTRPIGANQISIDLLAGSPVGTTLSDLSAADVANVFAAAITLTPPQGAQVTGLQFADAQDTNPTVIGGRNDQLADAFLLPYNGGNATLIGEGQLGNDGTNGDLDVPVGSSLQQRNVDDVDMLQIQVEAGTRIVVNLAATSTFPISAVVRFFDAAGNELIPAESDINSATLVTDFTGAVFIGISGDDNNVYNPVNDTGALPDAVTKYRATISVSGALAVIVDGSTVELGGLANVQVSSPNLFVVSGQENLIGIPVLLSRTMDSTEVATVVRQAIADRFAGGNTALFPTNNSSIQLTGVFINDAGPFVDERTRFSDDFGAGPVAGAQNNEFEGVYLDDFIIGFAERGEVATGSNVVDTTFIQDNRFAYPDPDDTLSGINTGSYQVEIRDASEYVTVDPVSLLTGPFRTFDTNDRLTDSRSITIRPAEEIRDGQTFSITDGRATVVFEFDQTVNGTSSGVTPGNVAIPFTLQLAVPGSERLDPISGLPIAGTATLRPQTAAEVAGNVINAINRNDVRSILEVSALRSGGVNSPTDGRVNLFGNIVVGDATGSLASIDRSVRRGDDNRDRTGQGVIMIENTRFLFNENYGLNISHDTSAIVATQDTPSIVRYPRNLVELNTESIVPGVVVQSNLFAYNGVGGIQVAGFTGTGESQSDPIPFERIVNNTIVGGSIVEGAMSPAETFQGTLFPSGAISFADRVVNFTPGTNADAPSSLFTNATRALGAPDCLGRGDEPVDGQFTVSLGRGGSLTVEFTNNLLTGSGDSRSDLIVFETGEVESVQVQVSRDGINFVTVGILGGLTNQIDLDASGFGPQDRFAFVRLVDLRQGGTTGGSLGADIDAIGALTTVPVDVFEPGGIAINVLGRAAPALLNNVVANSETGISLATGNNLPILGGNAYYRNTNNVPTGASLGQFSLVLSDSESVFVAPADFVFAPAAGSRIIDSSIDSVEDRSSLTTVKNPLGLPPSPILAPRLDVNGQLRIDDPNVETPSGLGERVFKDRGASDRGDLVGPRAVLLSPQALDLGIGSGIVNAFGDAPQFFEIQLIDGLAPADVVPGTGIDDRTVNSGSVLLFKDNVPLVEGVDYRFGYNPTTNVIRLTPVAGVFARESTYVIRLIDSSDAIISADSGDTYVDGTRVRIIDSAGQTTTFEYETGLTISFATTLADPNVADGTTLELFDGNNVVTFELDNDGAFGPLNAQLPIPLTATVDQIAVAVATAINNAGGLSFTATASGPTIQLFGGSPLSSAFSATGGALSNGTIGTSIGFGIQIPTDGARPSDTLEDGQTFTISRGASLSFTFEFDSDNVIDTPGARAIRFTENSTLDQIADEMVRVIGGTGLGLSPTNAGFGRVFLGGDVNYSLGLASSVLTQLGFAGEGPTVPIQIGIGQTSVQVAQTIQTTIDARNLPGVTTSLINERIFIEGTQGISGVGAVSSAVISDLVGNRLQSNQIDGNTELTIFVGSGFDYGDAPALGSTPTTRYITTLAQGGPRHQVDPSFSLGSAVSADSDAKLVNQDDDDGISIDPVLNAGFASEVQINVNNPDGRAFYVDAWFDWNGNGVFEANEVERFASNGATGNNRSVLGVGENPPILIDVPSDAKIGEIYARFRLSEARARDNDGNLDPTGALLSPLISIGDGGFGEVEDYRLIVSNNPFNNPDVLLKGDVNGSGFVSPLDALLIINAMNRYTSLFPNRLTIPLDAASILEANNAVIAQTGDSNAIFELPPFPDVNGDGQVSASDAADVIRILNGLGSSQASSEGESLATSFVPTISGVLVSQATLVGNSLIADESSVVRDEPVSTIVALQESKTSVFDHQAIVELDSVVDLLAEDSASVRQTSNSPLDSLDELFASI